VHLIFQNSPKFVASFAVVYKLITGLFHIMVTSSWNVASDAPLQGFPNWAISLPMNDFILHEGSGP